MRTPAQKDAEIRQLLFQSLSHHETHIELLQAVLQAAVTSGIADRDATMGPVIEELEQTLGVWQTAKTG